MIVHKYVNRIGGMGLGDFLRGSLACHQLCYKYGVPCVIDFAQHTIGKYLIPSHDHDISEFPFVEARNIGKYFITDLRNLICQRYRFSYLARNINNICVYTNVYPKFPILQETKEFLKQALIPTSELQDIIPNYNDGEYEVIHIRAGDLLAFGTSHDFVVNTDINSIISSITDKIKQIIDSTSYPILIMSDSLELKNILTEKFDTIKTETESVHLTSDSDNVVDTMIDFFTLTRARKIIQFSCHNWGSGFSDSVNWIYDVPIEKHQIL